MTEDNQKNNGTYLLKRPGLFAVKAILENARDGLGNFSTLTVSTGGVANRRDLGAYLRLLEKLDWLRLEILTTPGNRHRTFKFYEVTQKGRAFLDLFPSEKAESIP